MIIPGSNFHFTGKDYLDGRQLVQSKSDLKNWTEILPDGFEVYVQTEKSWYTYDSENTEDAETGKFRRRKGGNPDSIGIYTDESYERAEEKPDDYILIPTNHIEDLEKRETHQKTYTTSADGNVLDIMFSALRALQSKVSRLENTFNTGVVSLTENYTAASTVIPDAKTEEQEPLWAMDPEDLSEVTDASVVITDACDLQPVSSRAYVDNHIEVVSEASKDISQFMDFEISEEAKQCMYLITNFKPGSTIKVRLGYISEDTGQYDPNGIVVNLSPYLTPQKQNILLVLSRKVYDGDSEMYYGKNYLWISSTNINGQTILSKYFDSTFSYLSNTEKDLSKRYFISEIILDNLYLYQCNFYVKDQAYSNYSDIPPEKSFTDDFTFKAAHITIRSVSTYQVLLDVRSRLYKNELIWVEDKEELYIISGDSKKIVSLSSGGGGGGGDMTKEELVRMLQELGYVTADEELNSIKLNDISGLTFIHTDSGKKFEISVDSEGEFVSKEINQSIPVDEGAEDRTFAKRGAVARYNIADHDVNTTDSVKLSGTTTNIIARGDRVRFGSWYVPVPGQTQFNCTHDFIELVNSGTDDYPLDNIVLGILKGESFAHTAGVNYLGDATIDFFPLSGVIKAGSSYLIRGAKHLDEDDPRVHVNVSTYDKELWKSLERYPLERALGFILLHKNGVYDQTGAITFNLTVRTDLTSPAKTPYDVPRIVDSKDEGDSYFDKKVNPFLVDVVVFNDATIFRSGTASNVWGAGAYSLTANAIIKDEYSLDPAKQAFRSLTSAKETSKYRLKEVQLETIPLGEEKIGFYHSDQDCDVSKFTPKASFERKNVCTDKTSLNPSKPNMPTVSFGINMSDTRCFNWISAGTFNEYVWIRKKGETAWSRFESYKAGDGTSITQNGQCDTNSSKIQRKEFTSTVINAVYKRIEGTLPALETPFCVHKCILYLGNRVFNGGVNKQEYEYLVGRSYKNGSPNLEHCSEILTFTVYDPSKYKPIVYHVSDQQGFGWMEYQVWSAAANQLLEKINSDHTEPSDGGDDLGTFPILINTGDMTQNGTRINEWLDYYDGGKYLFNHLEQMNCVGNNDLANSYDHTALGTGDDAGKSSPYFFNLCYCYEIDGDNLSDRGNWNHGLVYNGVYIPSTYYFYSGSYAYLSVNSELTTTTCVAEYGANNYNLYTNYTVGLNNYSINYSDSSSWCLARTISAMLDSLPGKTIIVYCHEMPFTVITNDYLSDSMKFGTITVNPCTMDRSCQYSSSNTKSSLIGSHLNRISHSADYDNDDNYWFSRLLENKNIRLCIGGHKHSYTATWPVLEGQAALKIGDKYSNYDVSKLFVSVVDSNYYNNLPGEEITMNGKKYKSFNRASTCYTLLATTNENLNVGGTPNKKNGVVYFMCQATGYKLASNKELPSLNQIYSIIVPKTDVAAGQAHFSQKSPMYVVYTYDGGVINCDLYRIVNIKITKAASITEFSETKYSTKPMKAEKLLINLEEFVYTDAGGGEIHSGIYVYNNYWMVPEGSDASDYEFNYKTDSSDRCWNENGTIHIPNGLVLSNLFSSNHTLIVDL